MSLMGNDIHLVKLAMGGNNPIKVIMDSLFFEFLSNFVRHELSFNIYSHPLWQ